MLLSLNVAVVFPMLNWGSGVFFRKKRERWGSYVVPSILGVLSCWRCRMWDLQLCSSPPGGMGVLPQRCSYVNGFSVWDLDACNCIGERVMRVSQWVYRTRSVRHTTDINEKHIMSNNLCLKYGKITAEKNSWVINMKEELPNNKQCFRKFDHSDIKTKLNKRRGAFTSQSVTDRTVCSCSSKQV